SLKKEVIAEVCQEACQSQGKPGKKCGHQEFIEWLSRLEQNKFLLCFINLDKKREWEMMYRVKPDVTKGREMERSLQRIATGVVSHLNLLFLQSDYYVALASTWLCR
ncbi:hypothetical protein E2320_018635, partial [Naja naja]